MSLSAKITCQLPDKQQTLAMTAGDEKLSLTELLRRGDLTLNTRCAERGLCDGCVVQLLRGRLIHQASGEIVEASDQPIEVQGCEHQPAELAPITLRIPARSLLAQQPQIVTSFKINVSRAHDPLSDQPGKLGVAVDVGTTTVALMVVDLDSGRVVGRASAFNRQIDLGDDVLTRINLCLTEPTMLAKLQKSVVVGTIRPLLEEAMGRAEATADQIAAITVAGNTTMLHLFAGVDPSPMGTAPFTAAFLEHRELDGAAVGLDQFAHAQVHLLPSAAAYVGADLVAGVFASGLVYDDGPSLLVDVGTNGEIIARYNHHLLGCATAAGPAFEGAGLSCGMRAADGAVSHLTLSTDPFAVQTEVIGDVEPAGLCGTAYVDLLSEGRRIGLLNVAGRFDSDAPADIDEHLVKVKDYGRALRLARDHEAADIAVAETDIASLLQAKAAIAAGIVTLLERLGMRPADVKTLYLAGGFGMHLSVEHGIGCGLLPGFSPEQVQLVGNTSLAGAYLSLLDRGAMEQMCHIAEHMEVIELNLEPNFESTYIEQLMLPAPTPT